MIIIICLVLAVFTGWLEYRRADRSRLLWRILALLVAIIALACIALPIAYTGKTYATGDAVLLTENYNTDSLNHSGYQMIFTLDKDIKKSYPKAVLLSGAADINTFNPAIKQLHIAGYGLDNAELEQLTVPVIYIAPAVPQGVIAINWQQQLKTGDLLQIQGKYNNLSSKTIKLVLKGLNTSLDSVAIAAGKVSDFELNATPKITGRVSYALLAIVGKDTLEKEPIPVMVEAAKTIKVLMLSASPDFESKFLKNWLSENGYAIAARTSISTDKVSQDFVNMDKQPLDHLTPALLNKFDVVIGDLSTLKSLSPVENAALKREVEQNGLGVIIRADSSGKAASWLDNDFRVNSPSSKPLSVPLIIQGQKGKTSPLTIDPSYLTDRGSIQNLVFDGQNHVLAGNGLSGEGKLVFTTLRNTYTWELAGSGKDYSALWSLLISKAARKAPPVIGWSIQNGIATVNERVSLQLQSGTLPASISIDNANVSPEQSASIPYEWNISYWPSKFGWHQTSMPGNGPSWWYAYQKNDWKGIKNLKKMADTKKYSDNRGVITTGGKQTDTKARIEVPKALFYILLLLACTFLWVEHKLTV